MPERPRILLVYANPMVSASPVSPYGMERIASVMGLGGCAVEMIAPWTEADPLAALEAALELGPWALVGFSIRNLDDALVVREEVGEGAVDTRFFLEEIRPLVARAQEVAGAARVIAGGAAIAAGGAAVLEALGIGLGISGPGEDLAYGMARQLAAGLEIEPPDDPRVLRPGRPPPPARWRSRWRPPPGVTPRMGPYLGLTLARGGRVPVQLSAGCDRRCIFCAEARFLGSQVVPRPAAEVLAEIRALRGLGVRRFWLVASELNVPGEALAVEVLEGLAGMDLDLRGFFQAAPFSEALLDAACEAGLDPESVSFEFGHLDEGVLRAGGGPTNLRSIERLVELWLKRGYRTLGGSALFGAHPAETEESLGRAIEKALELDRALPSGLGLSYACGARVYANSPLGDWVAARPEEARPDLYTHPRWPVEDPARSGFVRPVIFARPAPPRALLRQVRAALSGARGQMGPMNAEERLDAQGAEVERLVNRGIWRAQEGRLEEARACLEEALRRAPQHLEALAQLAQLAARDLSDPALARSALQRLLDALPTGDPRREEVAGWLGVALRG